jgi:amidase
MRWRIAARLDRERARASCAGRCTASPAAEGQHRYRRPDDHHRRVAGAGRLDRRAGCLPGGRLREAGAVLPGQGQPERVGQLPLDPFGQRLEQPRRAGAQPLRPRPQPVGSSSGSAVAVAANLCAAAVGTETDGSIICPAFANGIVGIKPTLGLVSRAGIIPIAQPGYRRPMARTVADAALLLALMTGVDPRDPATAEPARQAHTDYTPFLTKTACAARASAWRATSLASTPRWMKSSSAAWS